MAVNSGIGTAKQLSGVDSAQAIGAWMSLKAIDNGQHQVITTGVPSMHYMKYSLHRLVNPIPHQPCQVTLNKL